MVFIESPLTHSKTELRERRGQAIQELELYGLRSRNLVTRSNCHVRLTNKVGYITLIPQLP